MPEVDPKLTRRGVMIAGAASMLPFGTLSAAAEPIVTVHRDPNCGCCLGWVQHLQKAGFPTKVLETKDLDAVKTRLGVPDDLAACHTAEVSGYVIEGHVPALALPRFLADLYLGRARPVRDRHFRSSHRQSGHPQHSRMLKHHVPFRFSFCR